MAKGLEVGVVCNRACFFCFVFFSPAVETDRVPLQLLRQNPTPQYSLADTIKGLHDSAGLCQAINLSEGVTSTHFCKLTGLSTPDGGSIVVGLFGQTVKDAPHMATIATME